MRKNIALSLAATVSMGGCMTGGVRPAQTKLQGGESSLISERLEHRPVEFRTVITAEKAPHPPTYIIRVIVPAPEKKPE